jgi:hypothetical protein
MKPNVIIRMGAAYWDARVRASDGSTVHFDFRSMESKERSAFHRELMNAFRATAKVTA